jgi:WhiB family transcriptional regulator, redox-sensing transcriptional regulator
MRWQDEALCAEIGGDLWFPDKGESTTGAKFVCRRCPVRVPCAEAGRDERFGIWGGTSEIQRKRGRKEAS